MSKYIKYRAKIWWQDTKSATKGVYEDKNCQTLFKEPDDVVIDVFWWSEGNGACDCNREIMFLGKDIGEVECGEGRFIIDKMEAIAEDGTVTPLEYAEEAVK